MISESSDVPLPALETTRFDAIFLHIEGFSKDEFVNTMRHKTRTGA
jgi:hypothetical protein